MEALQSLESVLVDPKVCGSVPFLVVACSIFGDHSSLPHCKVGLQLMVAMTTTSKHGLSLLDFVMTLDTKLELCLFQVRSK
jgi:hypothetical protein